MPEARIKLKREEKGEYDRIEKELKKLFKTEFYAPLLMTLTQKDRVSLKNAKKTALQEAIESGRISYAQGKFTGDFNAKISKELRDIGASYNTRQKAYNLTQAKMPAQVKSWISSSNNFFNRRLTLLDKKLRSINPDIFGKAVGVGSIFEKILTKADEDLSKKMESITVGFQLEEESRKRLVSEYKENMDKYIKDFTEKEIKGLRKKVMEMKTDGVRYTEMISHIKRRYGVSASKAKFLARQETGLMMSKYREQKSKEAGSKEYIWRTVTGTAAHPVRDEHKKLDGKKFKWSNPPITSKDGRRNHPGEDFNCRCFAEAIVEF